MRHHRIRGWSAPLPTALPPHPAPQDSSSQPSTNDRPIPTNTTVIPLQNLIASLRQHVKGDHVVSASVLSVEATSRDGFVLLLGEAEVASRSEPPRLEAHLGENERTAIEAELGRPFDPLSLVNRRIEVAIRCSLRQRYSRGAAVQAKVIGLYAIGEIPIDLEIQRDEVLRLLRMDGVRFGPSAWKEPEEPCHVAVIASEVGDALRDVEHVLKPLEALGLIALHRIRGSFEGPSAESSLIEAMATAEALHVEHGLSATLVVRGGGPASSFSPLNAWATATAARRLPNLVVGLGHTATPRTVLDEVAGRSVPTPTAAAMLIRDLVRRTAIHAEQALTALTEAIRDDVAADASIRLSRAMMGFEEAVRLCVTNAEQQLIKVGLTIERSLLSSIAAHAETVAGEETVEGDDGNAERLPDFEEADDPVVEAGLAMVIEAETGFVMTTAADARLASRLMLQFPDGVIGVWNHPKRITTH